MNFALYMTTKCNLACTYCYQENNGYNASSEFCGRSNISLDTCKAAVKYSMSKGSLSTGFCIYGGEPLLCKDTIVEFVKWCHSEEIKNHLVNFKIVTNGLLLDEEFIKFATKHNMSIAMSHDGLMQDDCRVYANGKGTREELEEKIDILLKYQPKAICMMTVDPSCVTKFAASVEYLFNRGFRVILATPRIARECVWDDDTLELLAKEYEKIAELYIKWTEEGKDFVFAPFDTKIKVRIRGDQSLRKLCEIGDKQPSILPDGKIYPCQQFIEDKFCIGDVFNGIDPDKLQAIREYRSHTPTICEDCDYRQQCRYTCCCTNYQCTGKVDEISPFQCEHERLLITNANRIADELYEKKAEAFIQKHYRGVDFSKLTEGIVT